MAAKAPFALKPGLCVRRVRFVMLAPDMRQHRRRQAGKPVIDLSEFPEPLLGDIGITQKNGPKIDHNRLRFAAPMSN